MRWRTFSRRTGLSSCMRLTSGAPAGPRRRSSTAPEALALARAGPQLLFEAPRQALVAEHHEAEDRHDVDGHGQQPVEPAHVSILVIRLMSRKPATKRMSATPSASSAERARGHPVERARAREVGQEQRSRADHHDDVGARGRARHERLDLALGLAPRLERRRHVRQRADEVAAGALLDGQRRDEDRQLARGQPLAEVLHRALERLADADLLEGDLQLGAGRVVELLHRDPVGRHHREARRRRRWRGSARARAAGPGTRRGAARACAPATSRARRPRARPRRRWRGARRCSDAAGSPRSRAASAISAACRACSGTAAPSRRSCRRRPGGVRSKARVEADPPGAPSAAAARSPVARSRSSSRVAPAASRSQAPAVATTSVPASTSSPAWSAVTGSPERGIRPRGLRHTIVTGRRDRAPAPRARRRPPRCRRRARSRP